MNNTRVLITGSTGYIGSNLYRRLKEEFPQLRIFGLSKDASLLPDFYNVNLLDIASLEEIIEEIKPHYIFHLAGVIYSNDWSELISGNIQSTINLYEIIKKAQFKCRIVVSSSAAEYGKIDLQDLPLKEDHPLNPVSPYGLSKAWQSSINKYYANQGLDIVTARLFNIIGPGMSSGLSIGAFMEQLKLMIDEKDNESHVLSVGNLAPKRDFLDIKDICGGLIALAEQGKRGEIYNICSGTSISMSEILHSMINEIGLKIEVVTDKARVRPTDISDIYGSNEKLRLHTNWRQQVSIESSISSLFIQV